VTVTFGAQVQEPPPFGSITGPPTVSLALSSLSLISMTSSSRLEMYSLMKVNLTRLFTLLFRSPLQNLSTTLTSTLTKGSKTVSFGVKTRMVFIPLRVATPGFLAFQLLKPIIYPRFPGLGYGD